MDMKLKVLQMSRKVGDKNKIPSKKDLVHYSMNTISMIMGYINKHVKFEHLTNEQLTELNIILEQSDKVLQSGKKHL